MVNINDVRIGDFFLLNYEGLRERCKVLEVNLENKSVHISAISDGSDVYVDSNCLDGIQFTEEFLTKFDFLTPKECFYKNIS